MQNVGDRFEAPICFKSEMEENLFKCKKRVEQSRNRRVVVSRQEPPAPSRSVIRRNERERNRVRMVNSGFTTLRQHVPKGTKNKKMSKVDTLKSAVEYIKQLQTLLVQDGSNFRATVKSEHNFEIGDERQYYENKDSMENLYSNDVAATEMDIKVRQSMRNNAYLTENSGDTQSPGYSLTNSPAPSWGSENNCSTYSNENSPEDDILTFATWFS